MILCPQQHKDTIDSVLGAEVHVCVLWLCSNEVQTQSCVIVASALMTSGPGVFTGGPWVTAGQFRTFGWINHLKQMKKHSGVKLELGLG